MSCKHELKTLSEPVVDMDITLLGGSCYFCPPIFQCINCKKVFKTGYDECELIEIPIKTIEEIKKEQSEYIPRKKKFSSFVFWMTLLISGLFTIMIILILLLME